MRYISTRGKASPVDFQTALLSGLASDGGLFVPSSWPRFTAAEIAGFAGRTFAETAAQIIGRFSEGYLTADELRPLAQAAYAGFSHADTVPLVQIGEQDWVLELFHGPTLAFKDVAMQFLGRLYEQALKGGGRRKTIIGATSGDTGGAAIEAFKGAENVAVFILHPKGRISDVQRRIMTTAGADNIYNIAVDGTFDDCQRIVKALFRDEVLSQRLDLGGVNSINWVRLAIQTVYYFTVAAKLGANPSFVVPTGNFGDVFAGFAAKKMGASLGKFCVAVNQNDIMHRALSTGRYEPAATVKTSSPSMDIQVASNFERLLFEASGRDADMIDRLMRAFDEKAAIDLPQSLLNNIREDFVSHRASEAAVASTIASVLATHDMLIDPHTAVGIAAHREMRSTGRFSGDIVTLATAHPAKFPEAVEAACGQRPQLPEQFADLFLRTEKFDETPCDAASVREYILEHI